MSVMGEEDHLTASRQLTEDGETCGGAVIVDADALDQFREIKSLSAGRP